MFGVGDGTSNVGLGILNSSKEFGKLDYRQVLREWTAAMPAEWGFTPENQVGEIRGAALPMGFNRTPHYSPGLLLLGDAGGMVSPFNGEGISYAMESARFAAEFIIDASARSASAAWNTHDADAHLSRYADYVRDQWGSHFTLGRAFAFLIGKPAVMKLALRTGMPIPVLMRFVVRLLANLTDSSAKGFEDRVIRVLEMLVPAPNTTAIATGLQLPAGFAAIAGDAELGPAITTNLARVEKKLREAISNSDPLADATSRHLVEAGGKRIRPLLTLLCAHLGDASRPEVVQAAVVVELTHLATLYHDDVMDSAPFRRGAPTAHEVWGNSVAILTGDLWVSRPGPSSACASASSTKPWVPAKTRTPLSTTSPSSRTRPAPWLPLQASSVRSSRVLMRRSRTCWLNTAKRSALPSSLPTTSSMSPE